MLVRELPRFVLDRGSARVEAIWNVGHSNLEEAEHSTMWFLRRRVWGWRRCLSSCKGQSPLFGSPVRPWDRIRLFSRGMLEENRTGEEERRGKPTAPRETAIDRGQRILVPD